MISMNQSVIYIFHESIDFFNTLINLSFYHSWINFFTWINQSIFFFMNQSVISIFYESICLFFYMNQSVNAIIHESICIFLHESIHLLFLSFMNQFVSFSSWINLSLLSFLNQFGSFTWSIPSFPLNERYDQYQSASHISQLSTWLLQWKYLSAT